MNDGAVLIAIGSKDVSLVIKLYNATTGALETGITETDLNIDYIRVETDSDVTVAGTANCVALATPLITDPHLDNGCEEIGYGYYRIDIPDAAFAVGATSGSIIITHDSSTTLPATIDWQADPSTNAYTWHVAKTGVDTNGGTSLSNAVLTIGQAVTNAASGDTILIWPGDYEENVVLTGKTLHLKGMSREVSKMVPATGAGIVMDDYCSLYNLHVEALQETSAGIAVDCAGTNGINIDRCNIYGAYDGVRCSSSADNAMITNSLLRGKYDALNISGGNNGKSLVRNCTLWGDGTIATYDTRGAIVTAGSVVFDNCTFRAVRSDSTAKNCVGLHIAGSGSGMAVVVNNCSFNVDGGANTTGNVCGLYSVIGATEFGGVISHCAFRTAGAGSTWTTLGLTAGAYDIVAVTGSITLHGCSYNNSVEYHSGSNDGYINDDSVLSVQAGMRD